jgi:electron transfer flavoprotein alpha subunit
MNVVVAEHASGHLNRASLEVVAAAQSLSGGVTVLQLGADEGVTRELSGLAVDAVVVAESDVLGVYTADAWTAAVCDVLPRLGADVVLFPHTYQTRDFAPRVAARLGRPMVTDCIGVRRDGAEVVFVRSLFQGKVVGDVVAAGGGPRLASMQIGATRADAVQRAAAPCAVRREALAIDASRIRQRPEPPFREAKQAVDLTQAERIVSVGRGIKSQEHIALAEKLAAALGAEVAASRPICDNGWLPMDRQIGSSGQTVAPKLYVALGISGAIQHLVGMKGARTIVAINKDSEAPIFEIADYGIVGDLFEIVPALLAELEK